MGNSALELLHDRIILVKLELWLRRQPDECLSVSARKLFHSVNINQQFCSWNKHQWHWGQKGFRTADGIEPDINFGDVAHLNHQDWECVVNSV